MENQPVDQQKANTDAQVGTSHKLQLDWSISDLNS